MNQPVVGIHSGFCLNYSGGARKTPTKRGDGRKSSKAVYGRKLYVSFREGYTILWEFERC